MLDNIKYHGLPGLGAYGLTGDAGKKGFGTYFAFLYKNNVDNDLSTNILLKPLLFSSDNILYTKYDSSNNIVDSSSQLLWSFMDDFEDEDIALYKDIKDDKNNNYTLFNAVLNGDTNNADIFNNDGYVKEYLFNDISDSSNNIKSMFLSVKGDSNVMQYKYEPDGDSQYIKNDENDIISINKDNYILSVANKISNVNLYYIDNTDDSHKNIIITTTTNADRAKNVDINTFNIGDFVYFTNASQNGKLDKDTIYNLIKLTNDNIYYNQVEITKNTILDNALSFQYFYNMNNAENSIYNVVIAHTNNIRSNTPNNEIWYFKNRVLSNLTSEDYPLHILSKSITYHLNNKTSTFFPYISLSALYISDSSDSKHEEIGNLAIEKVNDILTIAANSELDDIPIVFNNLRIPNIYDTNIETFNIFSDSNLILDNDGFIKPITQLNMYSIYDRAYIGNELHFSEYLFNTNLSNNYIFGYDIYDSNHCLIQSDSTSNVTLQMLIDLDYNSNLITQLKLNDSDSDLQISVPYCIQLTNNDNPTITDWVNKSYYYQQMIQIGAYLYALYINKFSYYQLLNNYNKETLLKLPKLLLAISSINDESNTEETTMFKGTLYTFAKYEYVDNMFQYIYYEDENLNYDLTNNTISVNTEAAKSRVTLLDKCSSYTLTANAISLDSYDTIYLNYFYIQMWLVNKSTGFKYNSKITKLIYQMSNNKLIYYQISLIDKFVEYKNEESNKDIISYELSNPITCEDCSTSIRITCNQDNINLGTEFLIDNGYKNSQCSSIGDASIDNNGSYNINLHFNNNLPNISKYASDTSVNDYIIDSFPNVNPSNVSIADTSISLKKLIDDDELKPASTQSRKFLISIPYNYVGSNILHYYNFYIYQPGFNDTRCKPTIDLYIETDINKLEELNKRSNCNEFKTKLYINVQDFYKNWVLNDSVKPELDIIIGLTKFDKEFNKQYVADEPRSSLKVFANTLTTITINDAIYNTYNDATKNIYKISGGDNISSNLDNIIHLKPTKDGIYEYDIIFTQDVPELTNLFMQFYISNMSITYTDKDNHKISQTLNAEDLYDVQLKYEVTYKYVSNKLDIMFNPIDYILIPDSYYDGEYHGVKSSKSNNIGSEKQITTRLLLKSYLDYSLDSKLKTAVNLNVNEISEVNSVDNIIYQIWNYSKIKRGYFLDNIKNIVVTTKPNIDSVIELNYNKNLMHPDFNPNGYTFTYNANEYLATQFNSSINVDMTSLLPIRADELIHSMDIWNDLELTDNLTTNKNLCNGKLSTYGNLYQYLDEKLDKNLFINDGIISLKDVKSINDEYIINASAYNIVTHNLNDELTEPPVGRLYRSLLNDIKWIAKDNTNNTLKEITQDNYAGIFNLYPRILYNYDFNTLNVLMLRPPTIIDTATKSFDGTKHRWINTL